VSCLVCRPPHRRSCSRRFVLSSVLSLPRGSRVYAHANTAIVVETHRFTRRAQKSRARGRASAVSRGELKRKCTKKNTRQRRRQHAVSPSPCVEIKPAFFKTQRYCLSRNEPHSSLRWEFWDFYVLPYRCFYLLTYLLHDQRESGSERPFSFASFLFLRGCVGQARKKRIQIV
jgi:hypothetical protein